MNWIILVLISTSIWSIGAIINKFCRVSYIEDSLGYLIFIAPTALTVFLLLLFEPFMALSVKEAVIAVLTGVLTCAGYYFYLEAIHKEELSRVYILFGIAPLFTLVLSTIFLKEILTMKQYIAFALIFIGYTLISLKMSEIKKISEHAQKPTVFDRLEEKIKFSLGALMVLVSALFFAIQKVTLKYISNINLTTLMIYRESGYILSVILLLLIIPKSRSSIKKVIKDLNLKQTALVYGAEMLGITGMLFSYLAIQRGPVSLISVLEGSQTIFIFIFTILISLFLPRILKEEINKKTIAIKIISIILMLGGLYLISV